MGDADQGGGELIHTVGESPDMSFDKRVNSDRLNGYLVAFVNRGTMGSVGWIRQGSGPLCG